MKRSGTADLPLHYGHVPLWLAERMGKLGLAITEEIISHKGKNEFLSRLSNPFWFQSLGAVMGMDWHSSGITTSVMGALKEVLIHTPKNLVFASVVVKENFQSKLLWNLCDLLILTD